MAWCERRSGEVTMQSTVSATDLASRVQALEDIEAIKRLKARWWFACDIRDIAGMRSCYDEDNFLIDFGFIGKTR